MSINTAADLSKTASSNTDFLGNNATGNGNANDIDGTRQSFAAIIARWYDDLGGVVTVSGTNTIVVTSNSTYQSLRTGMMIAIKAANSNTGATTLNLDSLGAKAVQLQGGVALAGGELLANGKYALTYDSALNSGNGAWVLQNPTGAPVSDSAFRIQDSADPTKQAAFEASGITTATVRTITLPDKSGTMAMTSDVASAGAFFPTDNEPPSSNYAVFGVRNNHPYLAFDTATQWTAIFTGILSRAYAGGGLTVYVHVMMASATSGTVGFDVAFERIDASSLDLDSDSFASAQTITATTVPGTSGQILTLSVAFTNGSQIDNLAAGEAFRLRLRRDVANDTAAGDAQVIAVEVKAT